MNWESAVAGIHSLSESDPYIDALVVRSRDYPLMHSWIKHLYSDNIGMRLAVMGTLQVVEVAVKSSRKSLLRPVRSPDPVVDRDFDSLMMEHEQWTCDAELKTMLNDMLRDDVIRGSMRSVYHRVPVSRPACRLVAKLMNDWQPQRKKSFDQPIKMFHQPTKRQHNEQ